MHAALVQYWSAVRTTFPGAWGKATECEPADALCWDSGDGGLMDPIMMRAEIAGSIDAAVAAALQRLAPHCCWTEGIWDELGWRWNEVESTPQHIKRLSDYLIRVERELSRRAGG
jgi:hypothetical protein